MQTILLISPYWKEQHRWMVSTVKLAELWQRLGYRVVVVCMGSETKVEKVSETLTIHFRKDFFLKDPLNFGIAFGFAGYVRRLIKEIHPDVVVCNKVLFWTSFSTILLRMRGIRVLLLTDALVGITWKPRGFLPGLLMKIGAWTMGWWVLKSAERIVFFHPQPEAVLKRLGIAEKSQVIPTGIDPLPFGKRAMSDERLAMSSDGTFSQSSKLKAQSCTVTYVGRLESVKGVDDFLAAVTPLQKEFPQMTIQVVGWYPSTSSGQAAHPLVKKYSDRVHFTGLRNDIAAILSETDIFVLPSHSEGLSNALMEAMASGCACIASDVGGNAFLIQNGVSGFLFPVGDREILRARIHGLMEDPHKRRAMGKAARERIEKVFSWDVVGKQYDALLKSVSHS
jgi:glycosyltransferase involved in cell wall biosynthesis